MSLYGRKVLTLGALALIAAPAVALADMGKPPVGPDGIYVSFEGGFLYQDTNGVVGHGVSPASAPATVFDVVVSPDSGWFAGGMIGFSSATPIIPGLGFRRIEGYALFESAEDGVNTTAPPAGGTSFQMVDGSTSVGPDGTTGSTTVERSAIEGGFRLERDETWDQHRTLTWVLMPFIRFGDEDTTTTVAQCCTIVRTGDVETWMYGITFAVEPEHQLSPGLVLVGRIGAGVYGYSADGHFASYSDLSPDPLAAVVNDDKSGVGFRGQLGAALKMTLSTSAILETFAEADYFSDVGTALMPSNVPVTTDPARVGTDDLWELRAGVRITIGTGK